MVFVIVSQRNSFHSNRASEKRDLWSTQLRILTGVCILCQFFDILTSRILCFQNDSISPRILLSHELELEGAAWTIAPLIPLYVYTDRQIPQYYVHFQLCILSLSNLYSLSPYNTVSWFFFALEETDINFSTLQAVLDRYDPHQVNTL